METTLDKFGRIVIPKRVREDLGLKPGSVLRIERQEEEIRLTPAHGEPHVLLKDGVLVFSGVARGDLTQAVRSHREQHIRRAVSWIVK